MRKIIRKKAFFVLSVLSSLFLFSGCEMLAEIDQGLYGVADAATQKDRITGLRTLSFEDRQAQIQKGNAYMDEFLAEVNKKHIKMNEDVDPAIYARLQNVFSEIHSVSHFREEEWKAILVDDDSFNAFTSGGTIIVVHKGLMEDASDAELATVIGHEMGHVAANHSFEEQAHKVSSLITGSNSIKRESYGAAFTHEQEREADRIGILYASLAGYDPNAAYILWQRKYEDVGDVWFGSNDHPVNSQRAAEAKATAAKVMGYYQEGEINPDFEKHLVTNTLWDANSLELEPGQGGGFLAALEATADALAKHKIAKNEEERQRNKNSFVDAVRKCIIYENTEIVAPDTFRITIHYRGNRAINNITFLAFVHDNLQIKGESGGPLQPNGKYYVIFQDKELLNYATLPSSTRIAIVDAR